MYGEEIVYIVDDDEFLQMRLELLLDAYDLKVEGYSSAESFLKRAHSGMRGCLILDQVLPEMSGLELAEKLLGKGVSLPVILISAHADPEMIMAAADQRVFRFHPKPFQDGLLVDTVVSAVVHNTNTHAFAKRMEEAHGKNNSEAAILPDNESVRRSPIHGADMCLGEEFRREFCEEVLQFQEPAKAEFVLVEDSSPSKPLEFLSDIWVGDLELVLDESA